ncbi:MAG: glycosyltransferase family 4 protein [Gammaproteobacteria bacterium]|nr:glycosyltransferase family 4 protein [Gammaproteobacteria bacterium]
MLAMKRVVGLPAVTARAYRKIDASRYDVVIANGEFSWGIDHPKTICLFHGSYRGFRDYLKPHLSLRQYFSLSWHAQIQRLAARGKCVVAVSDFVAQILEGQGIRVTSVIENSIDTNHFRPEPCTKNGRYLFVGSHHHYGKGFDVLEQLARRGIAIDCVTNERPGKGLGFINVMNRSAMPDLYRRYRMLVFPSRFEAAGLAPLEAMSCGLPVVMTNVGVGADLAKSIPDFVVDVAAVNLPALFAARIERIEADYENYAQAARDYVVRRYSYRRFSDEWRDFVREQAAC